MDASKLPLETKRKFNVFEGLVEVKIVKHSPPNLETVIPIKKRFSEHLEEVMKTELCN